MRGFMSVGLLQTVIKVCETIHSFRYYLPTFSTTLSIARTIKYRTTSKLLNNELESIWK